MAVPGELESAPAHLRRFLGLLAAVAVVALAVVAVSAVGAPVPSLVLPVAALVGIANLCPVWTFGGPRDRVYFDAADVGLVVALVLLPLPVALLTTIVTGLLTVAVEFRRSPVKLVYNAATVVLLPAASGALVHLLDPSWLWLPVVAAGACFLVDQLLAHPLLVAAGSFADGGRPGWRQLVLERSVASWAVGLSTALVAASAGVAVRDGGSGPVWAGCAALVAYALVSRSRIAAQEQVHRLLRATQVLAVPAGHRGGGEVLDALDAAIEDVAGVRGVRLADADAPVPPGQLVQDLPDGVGSRRLVVQRPLETGPVYVSRERAVRALLVAGAQAFVLAETTRALQHDVHHDDLTGLLNRPGLVMSAEAELVRAARARSSVVLLYVDLDGFKAVNDGLGHDAGDRALRRVATELRQLVRPHDLVARLSGDEFVLLLVDLTDGAGVVDRVRSCVEAGWVVEPEGPLRLSGSVGTARFPQDASDLHGLLQCADAQMYERKRSRRRGV